MVRIGIDARPLTSETTGLKTYSINIVKALLKHDSGISWFLYSNSPKELEQLIPMSKGYPIRGITPIRGISQHIFLPMQARKDKLDLMLFLCNTSWWIFGCDTAIVIHDLIPDSFPDIFLNTPIKRLVRLFQRIAYKNSSLLFTGSNHSRQEIVNSLKVSLTKIHTIPHGVDKGFSNRTISTDRIILEDYGLLSKDYILYVGSLDIRKNIPSLINAFAQVITDWKYPIKLALTGNPNNVDTKRYPNLMTQIQDLRIEEKVLFLGNVNDRALPVIFRNARVFVFPSLYEGFGLPPLEAMACGTPVVCSNVLPMTEILGDAAYYVNARNYLEIADSIIDILSTETLRTKLITKGLKHSKEYRWEISAKKMIELLKDKVTHHLCR